MEKPTGANKKRREELLQEQAELKRTLVEAIEAANRLSGTRVDAGDSPGEPLIPDEEKKREETAPTPPTHKRSFFKRRSGMRIAALAAGLAIGGGGYKVGEKLHWWGEHDKGKITATETEKRNKKRGTGRVVRDNAEEARRLAAQETPEVKSPVPETTDIPKPTPATFEPTHTPEVKSPVPETTGMPEPALTTTTLEPKTTEVKPFAPATPPEPIPTPRPPTAEELTEKIKTKIDAAKTPEAAIVTNRGLGGNNTVFNTNPRGIHIDDLHQAGSVVASKGEGGSNIIYNTDPEGIRGGEHFVGLSQEENLILRTHPEFMQNNPFHLTGEKLIEIYKVHEKNIAHIFQSHDLGIEAWKDMKDLKVSELLGNKNPDPNNLLMNYIHKLHDITKLPPQGGVIRRAETTEHYIARALQRVAKLGKLNQVNLE